MGTTLSRRVAAAPEWAVSRRQSVQLLQRTLAKALYGSDSASHVSGDLSIWEASAAQNADDGLHVAHELAPGRILTVWQGAR